MNKSMRSRLEDCLDDVLSASQIGPRGEARLSLCATDTAKRLAEGESSASPHPTRHCQGALEEAVHTQPGLARHVAGSQKTPSQ